ncbi:hypothetical protein LIER_31859 [Lithospermum erythrorhizon]|uniref:Uncharacterized protein n=1 Tax=Lithospermum erythrorhizon TaxID=34254 RepID=A0AAV3RY52_LITER
MEIEIDFWKRNVKILVVVIEEKIAVRPSPFEILIEQNQKKNKVTGVDEGTHNAKFNRAWEKYVVLFKARYGQDMDLLKFAPYIHLWDILEEVGDGRKKGRRLGFSTRAQSFVFNPSFPAVLI